jgi:hypothetical protein
LSEADLDQAFPDGPTNLGVLLGAPSGGLVDVDLDTPEACAVADAFLPATGCRFGRPSAPDAHRLYAVDDPPATAKYRDPTDPDGGDRVMLAELRSTGTQTLIPPSVHPSGEAIAWSADGDPARVDGADLVAAVGKVAAAALLARRWPGEGSRQDAALALAGGLARAGWEAEALAAFVALVAATAGDEEAAKRAAVARDSAATVVAGRPATGWPSLAELVGDKVVSKVRAWLGATGAGPAKAGAGAADREPSQASVLVDLALSSGVEVFHDAQGDPYAAFPADGHRETLPLRSRTVRHYLARLFFGARRKAPGTQALLDALQVLDGEARFAGPEHPVAVRLADHDGVLYLDLGDRAWRVAAIRPGRWELLPPERVPVRFRRPRGLLPLPDPVRGGCIGALRPLLSLAEEDDFLLLVAWLLGCLYPRGPRVVLQLLGEQGSAKSTLARLLRSLVDPNTVPLRAQPKDEGDLLIAAINGAVVALDNLSEIPRPLSDALCRLATGGGLSKRELYTDAEEVLLDAKRPVLLTAIAEVVTASDLLDRTVTVTLVPIPPEDRRTEAAVEAMAAAVRPRVLGALLDAAAGLAALPTLVLDRKPRMADFATWVEAAAPALGWERGAVLDALEANRRGADAVAIEALPVGPALLAFMADRTEWQGTATALLAELERLVPEEARRRDREWPKRPNRLSNRLRRLAPNLRQVGLWVGGDRSAGSGERLVTLTKNEEVWNRHRRHDRHTRGGQGGANTAGPSSHGSSHHRHGSSQTGAQPPQHDDGDDGDDAGPTVFQRRFDGDAAEGEYEEIVL